eukprot:COSAG06_NODE_2720_length_6389_cov_2.944833_2_plen_101_part_00
MDVTGERESQWDPPDGWEDEFYRRTSAVKPKSREGRQLAKLDAEKEKKAAERAAAIPREHLIAFSAPFYTENDHFTKTGSGQTGQGKLRKEAFRFMMVSI